MSLNLIPNYIFDKFNEASVEFLLNLGVKGVILDIDNTLEPYENDLPGEHVLLWLNSLYDAGIKTAIVSNNNKERVELFNREISMPAYYKAGKPFKKNIIKAMNSIGTQKNDTVFIGDQILTDVWGAHNAGIKAILVSPINDKTDPFTRFKRLVEVPFKKKYYKIHKKEGNI